MRFPSTGSRVSALTADNYKGWFETQRLRRIATCGKTGNGEAHIWAFPGCPTFKTVPVKSGEKNYFTSPPSLFISDGDGGWIDMGATPWNHPAFNLSMLPGWHPAHVCGMFCDGQDGNGECHAQKRRGPPAKTPLQQFTEEVWCDD